MNAMNLAAGAALACTVDRKAFTAALILAGKVTEARNTIPILSTVRLEVAGDVLTIEATDLDLTISQPLAATEAMAGAVCVELKALAGTVRKMTGERVRLQYVGGRAIVSDVGTGAATRLASLPVADWPCIALPETLCTFALPAAQLHGDLSRVRPAISTEETRYYLNGVNFHLYCVSPAPRTAEHDALCDELAALGAMDQADVDALPMHWRDAIKAPEDRAAPLREIDVDQEEYAARAVAMLARALRASEIRDRTAELETARHRADSLRMAATDGHRLHYVTRHFAADMAGLPDIILPRKAVAVALALIGKKAAGDAALSFSESKFAIAFGAIELRGKLIDGSFPDYNRIIPTTNEKRLLIDADDAAQLAGAATAHCSDRTRAVKLSLCAESVIFSATDVENGVAAVQAPAAEFEGEELAIGFNASYLADVAKQFAGSAMTAQLGEASWPTLFRGDDESFAAVLMPMRVDGGGGVLKPADIERMNRSPWENFTADAPQYLAAARQLSAQALPRHRDTRRGMQRASALAWSTLGGMVRDARAFLIAGGTSPAMARAMILAALEPESVKARAAAAVADNAEPRGTFAQLPSIAPAVVEAAHIPAHIPEAETGLEPAPVAQPVEEAPEAAEDAAPAAPEAAEAVTLPAAVYAALLARLDAVEALVGAQPAAVAEIPAPDPTPVQDPAPIEAGERAELVAEIDRLRALSDAQAVTIARLQAGRNRAAKRLGSQRGALKRERAVNVRLLGQIGDMLKRRGDDAPAVDAEPLPPVPLPRFQLPASLQPRVTIALPVVPSRPREVATV